MHNSSRYAGPGCNTPLRNKPTTPKDGRTYMWNTTQLPPRSFGDHAATRSSRTAGGTRTRSPQLHQGSLHIPCSYRFNTWLLEHQRRNQTFLYQQWENWANETPQCSRAAAPGPSQHEETATSQQEKGCWVCSFPAHEQWDEYQPTDNKPLSLFSTVYNIWHVLIAK